MVRVFLLPGGLYHNRTTFSDNRLQRRSFAVRCLLTVLPVSFFLFILSYVPLPSSISKTSGVSAIISRLVVVGTVILGLLSGFGSINNAWNYLPMFSRNQKYGSDPHQDDAVVLILPKDTYRWRCFIL